MIITILEFYNQINMINKKMFFLFKEMWLFNEKNYRIIL